MIIAPKGEKGKGQRTNDSEEDSAELPSDHLAQSGAIL
jgi:hypothetical protein